MLPSIQTNITEQNASCKANSSSGSHEISHLSSELKCSWLHSQELATSYYPESDQSGPCPASYFLNINFNVTFPSKPAFSKWSLSLTFPHPNTVCTSPFPPYMLHDPPINMSIVTLLSTCYFAQLHLKQLVTLIVSIALLKFFLSSYKVGEIDS